MYMCRCMYMNVFIICLEDKVVLVLPCTVVSVKVQVHLPKAVIVKKVVQQAYYHVGTFPRIAGLVNEVIHLMENSLTAYTKHSTIPCCLKIHRSRLEWIVRVVHLLGKSNE